MEKCNKCKFGGDLLNGEPKYVPGQGNPNADIMVISDYPDKLASYCHEPFKDEAAAAIDWMLYYYGVIDRNVSKHKSLNQWRPNKKRYQKVYYTTALKCFPSIQKNLTSGNIDAYARNACRKHHFREEMNRVKPKFILAIGNESLKMLRNDHKASATDNRGF
ncbi:MAG: hypothetical protein KAS39_06585, partial [Actinomycetia bacterium]|nr:hypothetical protein [Actinomycetes bacterium]